MRIALSPLCLCVPKVFPRSEGTVDSTSQTEVTMQLLGILTDVKKHALLQAQNVLDLGVHAEVRNWLLPTGQSSISADVMD